MWKPAHKPYEDTDENNKLSAKGNLDLPVQSIFKTIGVDIEMVVGVLRTCKSIGEVKWWNLMDVSLCVFHQNIRLVEMNKGEIEKFSAIRGVSFLKQNLLMKEFLKPWLL